MDQTAYEMSSSSEATPSIFLQKNWISILDNQNQNYSANQCVIDTSQLANSNKYMNYREGYLLIPLLISATSNSPWALGTATNSFDFGIGLKNSYLSVIHSLSLDLNGTTVCQTVPFQSLAQNFKLLTSLSWQEVREFGPSIGFWSDSSTSFKVAGNTSGAYGVGVCNNHNANIAAVAIAGAYSAGEGFNEGMYRRQSFWNHNPAGRTGSYAYSQLLQSESTLNQMYKSHIVKNLGGNSGTNCWQCAISAVVMLRHLHSFFDKCPLIRGCFFKLTLNLNQPTIQVSNNGVGDTLDVVSINSPLGGVQPLLFAATTFNAGNAELVAATYTVSLAVGAKCLNSAQLPQATDSPMARSVMLYVPSYVFVPAFEQAYLSQSVKHVQYEDMYFYQVLNQQSNSNIQALVTNGIAGMKSVLVIPFYHSSATFAGGYDPIQSPFDTAGGGTTSPMAYLNNFNIQISGQNALYNNKKYTYSNFLHNLRGINSVNGGQVDSIGSSLISQLDHESSYCYYYVDVSRSLNVEKSVPKSVQIIGQNVSSQPLNLYIFIAYEASLSLDVISGSRVA